MLQQLLIQDVFILPLSDVTSVLEYSTELVSKMNLTFHLASKDENLAIR